MQCEDALAAQARKLLHLRSIRRGELDRLRKRWRTVAIPMKNTIHVATTPSPREKHDCSLGITRRNFLRSTAAGTALATVSAFSPGAIAAEASGSLRVGLIGCGGRGTGAAAQALAADKNVKLVAMADAFANRLEGSLATLKLQKKRGRCHRCSR